MKIEAGLWIDHRKAVIVRLSDHEEEISKIESHLSKRARYSGASHDWSSRGLPGDLGEDMRDRRFASQLDNYYAEVSAHLSDAAHILVLGPGEAKLEFEACLKSKNLGNKIVSVEPADKMTEAQIASKVRRYFKRAAPKH